MNQREKLTETEKLKLPLIDTNNVALIQGSCEPKAIKINTTQTTSRGGWKMIYHLVPR